MEITRDVVSVSEMARMVGCSRARFYQLVKEGVFPPPTRGENGTRPFYDRDLQQQCVDARRTHRGINGKAVLFYAPRPKVTQPPSEPTRPRSRRSHPREPLPLPEDDSALRELRYGLLQLGISQVTERGIRDALAEAYPDGWSGVTAADLLRVAFARLNCQNSRDNVAG